MCIRDRYQRRVHGGQQLLRGRLSMANPWDDEVIRLLFGLPSDPIVAVRKWFSLEMQKNLDLVGRIDALFEKITNYFLTTFLPSRPPDTQAALSDAFAREFLAKIPYRSERVLKFLFRLVSAEAVEIALRLFAPFAAYRKIMSNLAGETVRRVMALLASEEKGLEPRVECLARIFQEFEELRETLREEAEKLPSLNARNVITRRLGEMIDVSKMSAEETVKHLSYLSFAADTCEKVVSYYEELGDMPESIVQVFSEYLKRCKDPAQLLNFAQRAMAFAWKTGSSALWIAEELRNALLIVEEARSNEFLEHARDGGHRELLKAIIVKIQILPISRERAEAIRRIYTKYFTDELLSAQDFVDIAGELLRQEIHHKVIFTLLEKVWATNERSAPGIKEGIRECLRRLLNWNSVKEDDKLLPRIQSMMANLSK
eukprot:TRINITY_DN12360_c0_g1_i1.p1 TRINITY_DN12360_c0_g1~~TRINITY_DN12360_c0_g1_i1.p1  ORF type:complete len:429 (+),score=89.77 TRINITY_DN12360_c0_g1_i1:63-1349(+)